MYKINRKRGDKMKKEIILNFDFCNGEKITINFLEYDNEITINNDQYVHCDNAFIIEKLIDELEKFISEDEIIEASDIIDHYNVEVNFFDNKLDNLMFKDTLDNSINALIQDEHLEGFIYYLTQMIEESFNSQLDFYLTVEKPQILESEGF